MSTQRIATGRSPGVYHKLMLLRTRTPRVAPPYQEISRSFPYAKASAIRSFNAGNRSPFKGLGPRRGGAFRLGNA